MPGYLDRPHGLDGRLMSGSDPGLGLPQSSLPMAISIMSAPCELWPSSGMSRCTLILRNTRTCPAAPPTCLPIPPWVAEPCLHSPASILVAPSIWGGGSVLYRMTARYPECRDGDGFPPRDTRRATFRSFGRPTGP